MTTAQQRLFDAIRVADADGHGAEYWHIVNDWVKDAGPARSLALHNINRTVAALLAARVVILDDDGCFHLCSKDGGR